MKELFGTTKDGVHIYAYTLSCGNVKARILNLGATLTNLYYMGKDVVCGFDNLDDIYADDSYQGAVIGRYANRIKGGRFTLNGIEYTLAKNDGNNHLHGGICGFNRKIWTVEEETDERLILSVFSPDGEEGYPGNVNLRVTYTVKNDRLNIEYHATSDADTPLNITNHAYFNIAGYNAGSVLNHEIMINADYVNEVDDELIPTGKLLPVDGTVFDLRTFTKIGKYIGNGFGGYDHNFILKKDEMEETDEKLLTVAARIRYGSDVMTVYTNQPCMQLYIGNALVGTPDFKGGYRKTPHTTYCLETQCAPDSPNHGEGILRKGEIYDRTTVFKFSRTDTEQ